MIALKSDKPCEVGRHGQVNAAGWNKQTEVGTGPGDPREWGSTRGEGPEQQGRRSAVEPAEGRSVSALCKETPTGLPVGMASRV